MNKKVRKVLENDIVTIKKNSKKEINFIKKQCSIRIASESSNTIEDIIQVLDDFILDKEEERKLLNMLKNNLKRIDKSECSTLLAELVAVNKSTLCYYASLLGVPVDNTIETTQPLLTKTESYRNQVCGLLLSEKDIKEYLNYPSSFWEYISKRTYRVEDEGLYGVKIQYDDNNIVKDISVHVPPIVNKDTAKINIRYFTEAYNMYHFFVETYTENTFSQTDKEVEDFEKIYLKDQVKKYFK